MKPGQPHNSTTAKSPGDTACPAEALRSGTAERSQVDGQGAAALVQRGQGRCLRAAALKHLVCSSSARAAGAGICASSEGEAAAVPRPSIMTPAGALLAGHVLRNGEVIQLVLKPSLWFIPLTCLRFVAVVVLLIVLVRMQDDLLRHQAIRYIEAGVFLIAGRLVVAILQWIGRLYLLTDQRILRLSGIFSVEILDCPLRKVAHVNLVYLLRERLAGVGSIEVAPVDEAKPRWAWQMVPKPAKVLQIIQIAIGRARQH